MSYILDLLLLGTADDIRCFFPVLLESDQQDLRKILRLSRLRVESRVSHAHALFDINWQGSI